MKKRRSDRKHGKNIAIIVCIVALAILLISGGAVVMNSYTGQKKLDENYCIADANQHKTAIFIDSSVQPLSPAHLRDYRTVFEQAYELTPVNTKIMVFTTASHTNGSLVKPVYIHCKPAMTAQEQENLGLPEKPLPYLKRQAKKASDDYYKKVDQILAEAQDTDKIPHESPILEQLKSITNHSDFISDAARSFIVITDGFQNSEIGSFCSKQGDMPNFYRFSQRPDYKVSIQPRSLKNTDVKLLLVEHGKLPVRGLDYCSNHELRSWWIAYFKSSNATSVNLVSLRYWGGGV